MQSTLQKAWPAIYRQHVYFLSSKDAQKKFIEDPLAYVEKPSVKPVVPIKLAIIGPPKSGKTTCKFVHCISYLLIGYKSAAF